MPDYHLLWLDLETTGLDSAEDHILEVGWTVTEPRVEYLNPLIWGRIITPRAEVTTLLQQSPEAYAMHKDSGLLIDLYQEGTVMLEDAEDDILSTLPEGRVILAGASVHFDRAFIARYMPRLNARLHYQHIDISTIRNMFEAVGIRLHIAENKRPHRAVNDIEWSLNYYYTAQTTTKLLWKAALDNMKGQPNA